MPFASGEAPEDGKADAADPRVVPRRPDARAAEPRAAANEPRPADAPRRPTDVARRPESRIPSPPRRNDAQRRGPEPAANRRMDPPRPIDEEASRPDDTLREPLPPPVADDMEADAEAPAAAQPLQRPRAAERLRNRFAANDDRRMPGAQYGLQRRPSRLIYPTAAIASAAWAIGVLIFVLTTGRLRIDRRRNPRRSTSA